MALPSSTPIFQPAQPSELPAEPRRVNNLTLLEGKTFLATTLSGDIQPAGSPDVGFFYQDTRFLSHLELCVNGHRTVVLSAATHANQASQIELTTAKEVARHTLDLPDNTVHIRREQVLGGRLFDRLTLENYQLQPAQIELEFRFAADFYDVFQVRGMRRERMGEYLPPRITAGSICFSYRGLDGVLRETELRFHPQPLRLEPQRACFSLGLGPRESLQIELEVEPRAEGHPPARVDSDVDASRRRRQSEYQRWQASATTLESSDDVFNACWETAVSDFFALRIPADETDGEAAALAAGIPWFAAPFGRDSLIACYQALMLQPQLAADTLRFLARYQGKRDQERNDEQPGKILHELRQGEMTRTGEMPFDPYYGSIDATPLFLIALSEYFLWTGDEALLTELAPAARRAMDWIERTSAGHGGWLAYQKLAQRGLVNQGWKDSWDAILHRDGAMAEPPIALCEVQGYAYDARYRWSRLLRHLGDAAEAERLRRQATEFARRFEREFWIPEERYYALALDRVEGPEGNGRPVRVVTSNAGHLLWSRIVGREHARAVAACLLREGMYSGWGVRTLAADEPVFNPLSYHRGSVWPHDNSLVAHGFALQGFGQPLERILTGLYQAARHFRDFRLPELFVGVERREWDEPVHYPVSCSPQAWASGSWFLLLTSMLGLRPQAARHELHIVNPRLPVWLDWLRLKHLRVGESRVTLEFNRRGERTFCNLLDLQGEPLKVSLDFW